MNQPCRKKSKEGEAGNVPRVGAAQSTAAFILTQGQGLSCGASLPVTDLLRDMIEPEKAAQTREKFTLSLAPRSSDNGPTLLATGAPQQAEPLGLAQHQHGGLPGQGRQSGGSGHWLRP